MSENTSIENVLKKATKDMNDALDNDLIMQSLVADLAHRLKNIELAKREYNERVIEFIRNFYERINIREEIEITNLKKIHPKEILLTTIIKMLSNPNEYDLVLINLGLEIGLSVDKVITLKLLNNITDVKKFCSENKIYGEHRDMFIELKKLSGIHNLLHNFD